MWIIQKIIKGGFFGLFHGKRLSFPAPAPETDARENAAFVDVEIDHAVVAVDVDGRTAENDEQNKSGEAEEENREHHKTAVCAGRPTAFFKPVSAMRAAPGSVGHLLFTLGAVDK
jgi:hypothetical protein